ncbi:hypothetical protein SAMN05660841_00326 [Sphingobacterium nematocida]|uniref:Uncharacterized protein n=1 Tax=Sphingobacterium nematocida TaxID=1513896 RepID=A0A1T5AZS2_9SPHI|nr:hypothetical protein [Sphingobacterium nematocida]SKB40456.1 hypothetical protein SAMN05660841_00326 [Sphingobacterium nematocida]
MNKMISFLLLIIQFGCKVNKEKSELRHTARQSQSRLETSTSWGQLNSQDSSYRYWHYKGDSSFFFHPDLGLWSRSGQIAYGEQRALKRQASTVDHSYDSIGMENNKTESMTSSKTSSTPFPRSVWLLIIIPLALLIYRQCWRKR